jgi:hypothetical protein
LTSVNKKARSLGYLSRKMNIVTMQMT